VSSNLNPNASVGLTFDAGRSHISV